VGFLAKKSATPGPGELTHLFGIDQPSMADDGGRLRVKAQRLADAGLIEHENGHF
jgi:hypothetical protein